MVKLLGVVGLLGGRRGGFWGVGIVGRWDFEVLACLLASVPARMRVRLPARLHARLPARLPARLHARSHARFAARLPAWNLIEFVGIG